MADDDDRTAVGAEGIDELVDALQVEVVRRLVEYEKLRGRICEQQAGESHAEPFATGEGRLSVPWTGAGRNSRLRGTPGAELN